MIGRPTLESARTFLFVPGDRPDRFTKAYNAGADAVVLDLEDAVSEGSKSEARSHVAAWLAHSPDAVVRVNAEHTRWFADDMAMISEFRCAVMIPKAEGRLSIDLRGPIIPLVETAAGITTARDVCASLGVIRAAFGSIDLAAQLGIDPDDRIALAYARSALVVASAAAGISAPIDGVTTATDDPERVSADTAHALRLGYSGKLVIHPRQIASVHSALEPTPEQVDWARRVVTATAHAAVATVDGAMVDKPVIERARRILSTIAV